MVAGEYFPYTLKSGSLGLLPSEFSRMRALKDLIAAVREYHPDVIYLRWSMYVYPLQRLFAIAPVVLEINTNDVEEHRLLGLVRSSYNRLTRAITLGGASGIVYATRELSELDVFQSFPKPGVVVSNSIDVDSVPFMPAPETPSASGFHRHARFRLARGGKADPAGANFPRYRDRRDRLRPHRKRRRYSR
jgi:hypothetical protein